MISTGYFEQKIKEAEIEQKFRETSLFEEVRESSYSETTGKSHTHYFRLIGTDYTVYPAYKVSWGKLMWQSKSSTHSFEEVLDSVAPELQVKLLYHLDLFR